MQVLVDDQALQRINNKQHADTIKLNQANQVREGVKTRQYRNLFKIKWFHIKGIVKWEFFFRKKLGYCT